MKVSNLKVPNTLVLIFSITVVVAVLTWIVPGGQYDRIQKEGREYIDPDSYHRIEHVPQGPGALFMAPLRGFREASNIIAFVLIVGGAFMVIQKTGAVDAMILKIAESHEQHAWMRTLTIPALMIIFSFFGSTFGMSEELIPFILIFVPLSISLGYDSIVGVAIPFVGAGVGFAGAFLNPFTIGIAQGVADLPPFSGIEYRIACWVIITAAAILFVMLYAGRIKKNPLKSPMYTIDQYWRDHVQEVRQEKTGGALSPQHLVILILFGLAIVWLVLGVTRFDWYITELSALFLALGIGAGLINRMSVNTIAESFIHGARELISVAFIIALAKSILVLASDGKIIDSILHALSSTVRGTHPVFAAQLMFFVQSVINVFIPSGSGQAALIMPIMAPLSDLLNVTRQTAVLAFQFGDGFTNLIIPTSGVTMGILGIARIPYEKWFLWMLPFQVILVCLGLLLLIPPVLMHWGPF